MKEAKAKLENIQAEGLCENQKNLLTSLDIH
jgi:hypothetical protein